LAALQAAGVGFAPHHTQATPLAGVQLTNANAPSAVEQSSVVHARLTWVYPLSVAAVLHSG
jgi:hypothetical protein